MPNIHESSGSVKAKGAKWRARLLQAPIHGSSGYYPEETVRRDGPSTWPVGTPIYFDHPSVSEREDRPERSVRDLAGKIASTPVFEDGDEPGLYSDVEFYSWAAGVVAEMKDDIGLSIRAAAEIVPGEVNGKATGIVTKLLEGASVDLVTKAGAGGKLVTLLESARPAPQATAEALSGDLGEQLRRVVRSTHADDEDAYVWVRDFDPEQNLVFFEADNKLWEQSYMRVGTTDLALIGDRVEVIPITTYHPVTQAGANEKKEAEMPNIEEARLAELTKAETRVPALESERDDANKRAEAAEARARKAEQTAYQTALESAVAGSKLHDKAKERLLRDLTLAEGADVPEDANTLIENRIKLEAEYLSQVSAPQKRSLGFSSAGDEPEVIESYANPWGRTINTKEA